MRKKPSGDTPSARLIIHERCERKQIKTLTCEDLPIVLYQMLLTGTAYKFLEF